VNGSFNEYKESERFWEGPAARAQSVIWPLEISSSYFGNSIGFILQYIYWY